MGLAVDILELLLDQVRVDLGGGDIGVAQHLLNGAQVRPILQQMGGKGVAQGMGGNVLVDLRLRSRSGSEGGTSYAGRVFLADFCIRTCFLQRLCPQKIANLLSTS